MTRSGWGARIVAMASAIEAFEAKALELEEKDRAELARVLLLSLGDGAESQDAERAWAEEAERRYRELETGRWRRSRRVRFSRRHGRG